MIFTKTKYPGKSHNLIVFIQAYCLYFDKKTVKRDYHKRWMQS